MAIKRPGPYTPLAANYADDDAIMEAGEDAELMYVRMLAFCGRTPKTEGWISDKQIKTRLGLEERAELGPDTAPEKRAERLAEVGLIDREGDGYRIRSWLKWNPSREEIERTRAQDRERKRGATSAKTGTVPESARGTGTGTGTGVGEPEKRREEKRTTRARAGARESDLDNDPHFTAFWSAYPRRTSKGHARKAWLAMLKKSVDPEVVVAAAREFARRCESTGTEDRFIPHPATWLNGERWTDQPPPGQPRVANSEAWMFGEA